MRVPVFGAHSEAVNVQTRRKLSAAEARELLAAAPGVELVDDPAAARYPMPLAGRGQGPGLRRAACARTPPSRTVSTSGSSSDNLRKGAALNAVQIAEELVRRGLL